MCCAIPYGWRVTCSIFGAKPAEGFIVRVKFDRSLLPPAPDLTFEQALWRQGFLRVAGLDEAGRGALAGPVYAAAVILPMGSDGLAEALAGVRDSKQLTPRQREQLAPIIQMRALAWSVGWADAAEIDQLGIAPATRLAFCRALEGLQLAAEHLLLDYFRLPEVELAQTTLVKGDQRSLSIACASILAKTARDAHMREEEVKFPGYGFAQNKGYGTAKHRAALDVLGPCPLHRRSFNLG
jgi:ribonuclease HII